MSHLRNLDPNVVTPHAKTHTRESTTTPTTQQRLDRPNVPHPHLDDNVIANEARDVMEAEYQQNVTAENEMLMEQLLTWENEGDPVPEAVADPRVRTTAQPPVDFAGAEYQDDKHDEAMEHLQTACRGGLSESYRSKLGAKTETSSGRSFVYVCSQNKKGDPDLCSAKGVLKPDWTWEAKKEHDPNCKCYNVFRGVLFSDRANATKGATTKNSGWNRRREHG